MWLLKADAGERNRKEQIAWDLDLPCEWKQIQACLIIWEWISDKSKYKCKCNLEFVYIFFFF